MFNLTDVSCFILYYLTWCTWADRVNETLKLESVELDFADAFCFPGTCFLVSFERNSTIMIAACKWDGVLVVRYLKLNHLALSPFSPGHDFIHHKLAAFLSMCTPGTLTNIMSTDKWNSVFLWTTLSSYIFKIHLQLWTVHPVSHLNTRA